MANESLILGALTLTNAAGGLIVMEHIFDSAPLQRVRQDYVDGDGSEIVQDRFPNFIHEIRFEASTESGKDALHAIYASVQTELAKINTFAGLTLQYTPKGATNGLSTDVLSAERDSELGWSYVHNDLMEAVLRLECKPYWYKAAVSIAATAHPINLLSEQQAAVETDTSGFTALGSSLAQENGRKAIFATSLQITPDNAAGTEGFETTAVTVNASTDIVAGLSIREFSGTGMTVNIFLDEYTAADALVGSTGHASNPISLDETHTEYQVTRLFGATGVKARLRVVTDVQQSDAFNTDKHFLGGGTSYTTWTLPGYVSGSTSFTATGDMDTPVRWWVDTGGAGGATTSTQNTLILSQEARRDSIALVYHQVDDGTAPVAFPASVDNTGVVVLDQANVGKTVALPGDYQVILICKTADASPELCSARIEMSYQVSQVDLFIHRTDYAFLQNSAALQFTDLGKMSLPPHGMHDGGGWIYDSSKWIITGKGSSGTPANWHVYGVALLPLAGGIVSFFGNSLHPTVFDNTVLDSISKLQSISFVDDAGDLDKPISWPGTDSTITHSGTFEKLIATPGANDVGFLFKPGALGAMNRVKLQGEYQPRYQTPNTQ